MQKYLEVFTSVALPAQLDEIDIKVDYREVFNYFDVDKDGLLDRLELSHLFNGVLAVKGEVLKRIATDSKVDLDELVRILRSQEPSAQLEADLAITFETYKQARKNPLDLRTVSAVEVRGFLPRYFQVVEDRVNKIINLLLSKTPNANDDDTILFENFLEVVSALLTEPNILNPTQET